VFSANLYSADYWVLAIAAATYLILANHKHQSNWIQDHSYVIWILPWLLSFLWAIIGLAVVGYGDIGAWCWFTSDRVRLLVNFLPRWLIIIIILGLYLRLYFIIHKAHSRFMSFDEDATGSMQMSGSRNRNNARDIRVEVNISMTSSKNGSMGKTSDVQSDDCERAVEVAPTHARIPRASPHLKRVRSLTIYFPIRCILTPKQISYQMMTYPLVYMLIWTIPTVIRIYQATTGNAAPFGIGTVDKACIVIQGFADALVYGLNERTWAVWRDFILHRDPKTPSHNS
jgi:hypothetical protein